MLVASALQSLAMTRLTDRLGPASLIIAVLAIIVGVRLTLGLVSPGLGVIAALLAWPGLRKQATIATVYNRSTSAGGGIAGCSPYAEPAVRGARRTKPHPPIRGRAAAQMQHDDRHAVAGHQRSTVRDFVPQPPPTGDLGCCRACR
ncbi:MAG TPA: hypothetical protein VM347_44410 [Nonomuraea sp.]|nr:hypothetical protein [Nonomuraea sp.]